MNLGGCGGRAGLVRWWSRLSGSLGRCIWPSKKRARKARGDPGGAGAAVAAAQDPSRPGVADAIVGQPATTGIPSRGVPQRAVPGSPPPTPAARGCRPSARRPGTPEAVETPRDGLGQAGGIGHRAGRGSKPCGWCRTFGWGSRGATAFSVGSRTEGTGQESTPHLYTILLVWGECGVDSAVMHGLITSSNRNLRRPPSRRLKVGRARQLAAPGPLACVSGDGLSVGGQLVAGFELGPVNLELMADAERDAALSRSPPSTTQSRDHSSSLSVPADRNPDEHLAAMEERVEGRRIERAFARVCRAVPRDRRRPAAAIATDLSAARRGERARAAAVDDEPRPHGRGAGRDRARGRRRRARRVVGDRRPGGTEHRIGTSLITRRAAADGARTRPTLAGRGRARLADRAPRGRWRRPRSRCGSARSGAPRRWRS